MFKEDQGRSGFSWKDLGDIESGRPNLGPKISVLTLEQDKIDQFVLQSKSYGTGGEPSRIPYIETPSEFSPAR